MQTNFQTKLEDVAKTMAASVNEPIIDDAKQTNCDDNSSKQKQLPGK